MLSADNVRVTFKYLSEPDMIKAGVMDMAGCVDAMEDVFRLINGGDYRLSGADNDSHGAWLMFPDGSEFPGMPLNAPDRRFMAMPAYLGGAYQNVGMKWYGSNVENKKRDLPRSILVFMLNDPDTGAPKALMSANLLSAMRTGAVPGVGARYFAKDDSRVLGIIGPGVMNKASTMAFMVECPQIDTLQILGRSKRGIDGFVQFVKERYPAIKKIKIVESLEDAVRGADIVSVAVTASDYKHYPLVKREWVKPGALLSMPGNVSIDDGLCHDDVLKTVDSIGLYEAWARELPSPHHHIAGLLGNYFMDLVEAGELAKRDIVDLGDVICGKRVGRTDARQIVLFSVGGIPLEDVAWGTKVYEKAVNEGIGTDLLLWNTPQFR